MRLFQLKVCLLHLLLIGGCDSANEDGHAPVEITIMAVYTSAARLAAGDIESVLYNTIEQTNQTYANSAVDLRLRLVHQQEVDYAVTDRIEDLRRLLLQQDGILDEVHAWRDEHEADLVAFVSDNPTSTINASIMAEKETAFVVVYWEVAGAPEYGLAHEIGHLFGARHSPDSDAQVAPFRYGHGYRDDRVRTIMANGPQPRIPYYSGPDQMYEGVTVGDSTLRDVARMLRESAVYISNFRGAQTATAFTPPGTWPTVSLGKQD
jgi:hypothetical protein